MNTLHFVYYFCALIAVSYVVVNARTWLHWGDKARLQEYITAECQKVWVRYLHDLHAWTTRRNNESLDRS